ncbi:HAD family hydrolase [Sporanaerobacter sp. PP17-6a]|uniref:HAD family hydrolase n=1 Tax=Sporanaerobacter sp. PP17-6a TaxID=1891289 RepID=UPI00089F985D|nr:HAD family hydrolase [Sporanaerobacter sp. PP17-6a]SCL85491.1 haloacid dehalogenase-like hydrolase [Sporanaerobacter sp. PP17-6a]
MSKENGRKNPIIAICYDFDKTLSPDDMQAQGFIQSVGFDVNDFWEKSNTLAKDNDMDQNLAYMYEMSVESTGNVWITKESLAEYGAKIKLFPGVEDWFDRINAYGEEKGVVVEHYVISSGLKEMIEGTAIADKFKRIYACSFYYGEHHNAVWPAQSVNYTNKTQFLFRIEKGVLDVYDQRVNDHFQPSEMRIPFKNMIYIGDSDTDVPCMKLVNEYGGYSIGVYNPDISDRTKVFKIYKDGRIKLFSSADYTNGSELDTMIKSIIDKVSVSEAIENYYLDCQDEVARDGRMPDEIEQDNLISSLEESDSFARTHAIIKKCLQYKKWSQERTYRLCNIAINNSQISSILVDYEIKLFYNKILDDVSTLNEDCETVRKRIK